MRTGDPPARTGGRKIRVLIIDDSAIVRKILTEALTGEPDLEVIGTAPDPYVARDKILALRPDVLTLDIEMPRMDGLTFLQKLMEFHPLPTVVISSLAQSSCRAAVKALEFGAVEVLPKPGGPYSVGELRHALTEKIRAAAASRVGRPTLQEQLPRPLPGAPAAHSRFSSASVIAIGASTGGTEAIASILPCLPESGPGILIAQHLPAAFTRAFASRLNENCAIEVREAEDGDTLRCGMALIAPGDHHLLLRRLGTRYVVEVNGGPRVCYQRPSVDVLFLSVAEAAGCHATGVLLTGMGSDGARGLLKMRESGARTIAQDESTSVVYGMPREAARMGAAGEVLPLYRIPKALLTPRKVDAGAARTLQ